MNKAACLKIADDLLVNLTFSPKCGEAVLNNCGYAAHTPSRILNLMLPHPLDGVIE